MRQLAGLKTGYLEVLYKHNVRDINKRTQWVCLCLCGNRVLIVTHRLTDKNLKRRQETCGNCEWHIRHKEAYTSWMAMQQRCYNPDRKDYKYYGGRGIKICADWLRFQEFYKDMGDPPKDPITGERLSLDRMDNNKNYSKDNCKWSDRSEQQLNKNQYSKR